MYHVKYSQKTVETAIRKMANTLKKEHVIDENTIFLVMISGGVWFATHLFDALGNMSNEVHYLKGHSYAENQRQEFVWDFFPDINMQGQNIVIIDDICDSGETIKAVYDKLQPITNNITAVTLLQRLPNNLPQDIKLYACINDYSTQFFVGCGLDDNGHGRLLKYIGTCK